MTKTKTKQEYIEIIRKKCVLADESILELKFGCEIQRYRDNPTDRRYKVIEDIGYANNKDKVWINSVPFGSMQLPIEILKSEVEDKTGNWIIIGRKIGIAEILVAVNNGQPFSRQDGGWVDIVQDILLSYNLKDDNIKNQDLLTLKWLVDLLDNPKDI